MKSTEQVGERHAAALTGEACVLYAADRARLFHETRMSIPAAPTARSVRTLTAAVVLLAGLGMVERAPAAAPAPVSASTCAELGLSACPEPFDATIPAPSGMLTWDPATRVVGFRNTYRQYPGDVFHTRGAPAYALPPTAAPLPAVRYRLQGQSLGVDDYLKRQNATGLLVLKDGRIALEYYGHGNTPTTLWTSRSVAKSVVSVLVGIAIKEGKIGSVADRLTRYVPELEGTAWADVTLKNLLQHTSGVLWNEDYADPKSDFARLTACEAGETPYPCIIALLRGLRRAPGVAPGERWSYNTAGAWLVGVVLEHATGMTIASYLESRLWSRFAMEHDGVWQALVKGKIDMGGHGFNATLRDWGRFGLFVANGGKLANGEALLPPDWIRESTTWTRAKDSVTPANPAGTYGYQWWSGDIDPRSGASAAAQHTAARTFWAQGIYGQGIAINASEHLVLVQWSAWDKADGPDLLYEERSLFFNALVDALRPAAAR